MIPIHTGKDAVSFKIKVHPRAKSNALTGVLGEALKLALTSPPVDGKANSACIGFFADLFKVPKSSVTIAAGETGRNKVIRIVGITAQAASQVLSSALTKDQ